jgi:asparagine synthase (glutamine-hydrolysing)
MKNIKTKFTDHRWLRSRDGAVFLRGTAFADGAMLRAPEDIQHRFPAPDQAADVWMQTISGLNGFFALVSCSDGQLVAAVDRIRSIPLFFGETPDTFFLGDDAEWIRNEVGDRVMDPVARDEFRLAGYVTGSDTLYPHVKQLQAGELLVFDGTQSSADASSPVSTHRYYRFVHHEPRSFDENALLQNLDSKASAAISRLIEYAGGRQIAIPLSGGYDSRLIATLLCRQGYRNVLAFTYGIKGNKESAYSREVAQALGIPWHFVEYSEEQWCKAWDTDERREYQKWASGWTSLPHAQDWIAVRVLEHKRIVDRNCIFVPGHSGDFIAGSHIPDDAFQGKPIDTDRLVERILDRHYALAQGKQKPEQKFHTWKDRVLARAEVHAISNHVEFADTFEKWDWQERQAKYIVNSVRVYEFFGHDWWLPLWDAEFMDFWQNVPLALRKKRHWYLDYVKHVYAGQVGADKEQTLGNSSDIGLIGTLGRSALKLLPRATKDNLKAMRHVMVQKHVSNNYLVSHLPTPKVMLLQSKGHSLVGILADEFLGLLHE